MKKGKGIHAIGKRKTSVARVYLKEGNGTIIVNDRPADEYFGRASLRMILRQPLVAIEGADRYDVAVNVSGGGIAGQAGAVRHGIARALVLANADLRKTLKKAMFLRRDPRAVERKKYGRHKARKRPQFSKR